MAPLRVGILRMRGSRLFAAAPGSGSGSAPRSSNNDFVPYRDLDFRAGVFPNITNQLRQTLACFANRYFHVEEVYEGVQGSQ